jgi:hypothetical protein
LLFVRILGNKDTAVEVLSGAVSEADARATITCMAEGDVLILEEIHRMVAGGKANAEWLLHFLLNGAFVGPLGVEEMAKITVVATTTEAGKLPPTILGRFPIKPPLTVYSAKEATNIVAAPVRGRPPDGLTERDRPQRTRRSSTLLRRWVSPPSAPRPSPRSRVARIRRGPTRWCSSRSPSRAPATLTLTTGASRPNRPAARRRARSGLASPGRP